MYKRQDIDYLTIKSNNPKELSPIMAVIIGCVIGIIISFMIYTYVPKPAFINKVLMWWFSGCHTPPLPSPPISNEGQEQIPITDLPNQITDNNHSGGADGIQNLQIENNNNNNDTNINDIELTDFNTSTTSPPNTTTPAEIENITLREKS